MMRIELHGADPGRDHLPPLVLCANALPKPQDVVMMAPLDAPEAESVPYRVASVRWRVVRRGLDEPILVAELFVGRESAA